MKRTKWVFRGLVLLGVAVQVGFVAWELIDFRGGYAVSNAVGWLLISALCGAVTWVNTGDWK